MRISTRWLARHVDLSGLSPAQIGDDLTLSTAEVEGVEPFAPHLAEVVVGRVLERERHPDADKLSLCRVDVGAGAPLSIVCGAPNVAAGQKVAVARPGTELPGGLEIKKSKIRGVASEGMICSVRELDLGDEHEGIWVLDANAPVGRSVADALDLHDHVIEIDNKSLTHRPDLWGHRGIAGELAAIYGRPLRSLDTSLPRTGSGERFPVRIETPACTRYFALAIDGVVPARSPDWLRFLLLAVGQRPLDLLVDLSNFVMLDLGQPNHAFDRNRLAAGIEVRMARADERMETLDGQSRALAPSDILICSGSEPVALAGIMGGAGSKIEGDTSALLLEVATFDAVTVRRTSSRLALRTESSARFEKSLDPTAPPRAAGHFARLLREIQPDVRFPAPPSDEGSWRDPAHTLHLRSERVRAALGTPIADGEIGAILARLGFGVRKAADGFDVDVPACRATKDITIERDLVEEVGRIHRYGNIPERALRAEIAPPRPDPRRALVRRVQDRLAGAAHFHETLGYSFVADELVAMIGEADAPYVRVVNPAAQGQSKVRRSVLPSLLPGLAANRRLRDDVRLFEVGKGYAPEHANERGEPRERHLVGLVWAGTPPGSKARFDASRLARLHGVVADLLDHLGLGSVGWSAASTRPAWAHPAKALEARVDGVAESVAVVAELEPALAAKLGLSGELASDVAAAEISLDAVLAAPKREGRYRPIPRFPGIKLDVAVALDETTPARALEDAIREAGGDLVAETELFDLYRGANLGAGRKSLAYHVLLQSPTKTLTEKDEQRFLKKFEQAVAKLGGELRKA